MKKLKKVFALALAAMFLLVLAAPSVFAADDEMVVAYVQVPDDWENPCFWAWDDDGNNAFDAWPGGEAEADPENEGWYYCWLPSWVSNVIVNANDGGVQTSDFKVEGKNVWISIKSPDEVELMYEAQTKGEAPAYVEKMSVHARVPDTWTEANIWAWLHPDGTNAFAAWPGEAMKQDDSGWYTAKVPIWVNSVIINAGEGNPQTEDLTVEAKEMWITVSEDGTAELAYENPDLAVANITVRVKAPADWQAPCLWAWSHPDGTNVFSAWPGEPLAEDGDWLSLEVPGWINRIIVNGNAGTIQTADIEVEVGKDIWLVVGDDSEAALSYEEPELAAETPVSPAVGSNEQSQSASQEIKDDASKSNVNIWLIVGIAAAVIVVIVIIVVVRKKKTK